MLATLKNLTPELHFLIFNGSSVPILGRLRRVCKKISACAHLKNLLDAHEDHARIRFEKVVYTAKPFFPKKIRNHTITDELIENDPIYMSQRLISIAGYIVGEFYYSQINKIIPHWDIVFNLPKRWTNFFQSHNKIRHKMFLHKHFHKKTKISIDEYNNYWLSWRPRKSQITESKYVNYAEAETQFWAVFSIVYQWTPEDFFASTQMFF